MLRRCRPSDSAGCTSRSAGARTTATGIAVIRAALEHGVTLIDTADVYCLDDGELGHNERLVAAALRAWAGPASR